MNELLTTVPIFSGEIHRFSEFKRLFDRAVHNLPEVPDEIKYEKLMSKLSPNLRSSFSGTNYTQLYSALVSENSSKYRLARSVFSQGDRIPMQTLL